MTTTFMKSEPRVAGFTLVEMLVVLAIIALVAAMSIPLLLPMMRSNRVQTAAEQLKSACIFARSQALERREVIAVTILEDERAVVVTEYDKLRPSALTSQDLFCPHDLTNYAGVDDRFQKMQAAALANGNVTAATLPEGCRYDLLRLNPSFLSQSQMPPPAVDAVGAARAWTYLFRPDGSVWTLPSGARNDGTYWWKTTYNIDDGLAGPIIIGPERREGLMEVQTVIYAMTGQPRTNEYTIKQ